MIVHVPTNPLHRKLSEIPNWELNGEFSHSWEKFGTGNSFFGETGFLLGKKVYFPFTSQYWEYVVNVSASYSQSWEQYGNISQVIYCFLIHVVSIFFFFFFTYDCGLCCKSSTESFRIIIFWRNIEIEDFDVQGSKQRPVNGQCSA